MVSLQGKIALVTGGTRGIGKAIALELIKEGATVIINYSKNDISAEETYKEVQELGGYAKLYKGDISNYDFCKEMIDYIIKTFGKIDILINNAAVSFRGLFMDFSSRNIENIFGINVFGAMYLSKEVIPHMINKGSGNIINISSIWGESGASCEVLYSSTKGAINLFTKSLAKELAPMGIRVNGIAPGVIDTEMNSFLSPEEREELENEIPVGRFGDPKEVAELVLFLCSEKCTYINGQILKIDGAML